MDSADGESLGYSYNHIAFRVEETDLDFFACKIQSLDLDALPSRPRDTLEEKLIYFYDYDNHLFELHTGDLQTRLTYYQAFK